MAEQRSIEQRSYHGKVGERSAYRIVPLARLTQPRDGALDCRMNRYWAVCDEGALFFRGWSPQCNVNREIVERTCPSWARVQFIPMTFTEHTCE